MRVLSLSLVTVLLAHLFALGTAANASWKSSILNIEADPVSVTRRQHTQPTERRTTRRATTDAATSTTGTSKQKRRLRNRRSRRSARSGPLRGLASYYWQRQRVASGGWFNPNALTAAHKTLRFGTRVRVTNLRNGRSVVVRINDRGPYIRGRIIDLSRRAATIVGMRKSGVVPVQVEIL